MTPIIQHETVHFNMLLEKGVMAHFTCTNEDSLNFETGDSIELTSIDSIVSEDGQMIHPKTLTIQEFKQVTRRARRTTFL